MGCLQSSPDNESINSDDNNYNDILDTSNYIPPVYIDIDSNTQLKKINKKPDFFYVISYYHPIINSYSELPSAPPL